MSSALACTGGPPYALADWESLDEDPGGNRVELIGGHFKVTPGPSVAHQAISDALRSTLHQALLREDRTDLLAVSGVGISVVEGMGFVPDISVLPTPSDGTIKVAASEVLLAVEVVSPRTRKDDRMVKPEAYAQAGVPFYWRVEPMPGAPPAIFCFQLAKGRLANAEYAESAVAESGRPVAVKAAPVDVELDVDALYEQIFGGWSH